MGHRGVWVADDRGADPCRGAALLQRQPHLRRTHDGGRGLYPGPVIAALVRRQLQHDRGLARDTAARCNLPPCHADVRSEEHTSELQSPVHLVCRLLLEKKKTTTTSSV